MKYAEFVENIKSLREGFPTHHEYLFERINSTFDTDIEDLIVYPKFFFEKDFENEKTLYIFEEKTFTEVTYLKDMVQFRTFPNKIELLTLLHEKYIEAHILEFTIQDEAFILHSLEDSNEHWNRKFKEYLQNIYLFLKERL